MAAFKSSSGRLFDAPQLTTYIPGPGKSKCISEYTDSMEYLLIYQKNYADNIVVLYRILILTRQLFKSRNHWTAVQR